MSRDWLADRPGREEEDLERGTEDDEEEERARDLYVSKRKRESSAWNSNSNPFLSSYCTDEVQNVTECHVESDA